MTGLVEKKKKKKQPNIRGKKQRESSFFFIFFRQTKHNDVKTQKTQKQIKQKRIEHLVIA
jgi:hypothetical protein